MLHLAAAAGLGVATACKLHLFNPLIFLALVGETETFTMGRARVLPPAVSFLATQPSAHGGLPMVGRVPQLAAGLLFGPCLSSAKW